MEETIEGWGLTSEYIRYIESMQGEVLDKVIAVLSLRLRYAGNAEVLHCLAYYLEEAIACFERKYGEDSTV